MGMHNHPLRLHSSFADKTARIRADLLKWYAVNARPLPWRTPTPSPYAILVSEIMCQQTQIKTVLPYFERWMTAFPTFKDLAAADVDEVMRLWSGLGYYSRGRKLLEAAKWIEENGLPKDVAGWKKVPGCGDYTAGAVSSIAFGIPTGAVDGNVCRVFSRLFMISTDLTKKEGKSLIWGLANELVDPENPGHFNQAVMEIGALVCTPQNPNCDSCPVSGDCLAFAEAKLVSQGKPLEYDIEDSDGCQSDITLITEICGLCPPVDVTKTEQNKWISSHYPRKAIKKAPQEQQYITAVISRTSESGPEYFLVQRPETGLLAGLWDFPNIALEDVDLDESSAENVLLEYLASLGLKNLDKLKKKGSSLHIFTHIRRTSQVYTVHVDSDMSDLQGQWATEETFAAMAVSELGRKVLRLALGMEKKRKHTSPDSQTKIKSRKTVKLEKGQTKLSFSLSEKTSAEK